MSKRKSYYLFDGQNDIFKTVLRLKEDGNDFDQFVSIIHENPAAYTRNEVGMRNVRAAEFDDLKNTLTGLVKNPKCPPKPPADKTDVDAMAKWKKRHAAWKSPFAKQLKQLGMDERTEISYSELADIIIGKRNEQRVKRGQDVVQLAAWSLGQGKTQSTLDIDVNDLLDLDADLSSGEGEVEIEVNE